MVIKAISVTKVLVIEKFMFQI